MSQTIESYLVSLGFSVKQPELDKFNGAIADAGKAVQKHTSGIIGDLFKMQFALTSAFLAVGAGVVAMVDKVAMADQSYRLLGMQMFMSKNAAQSMDIALKALGATIDQVAWDPELHARFVQLQQDQRNMMRSLGPDFETNMRQIRDLRFEYSRFTVELQYLGMGVVNDIFTKLGLGSGTLLDKFKQFNDYLIAHMPEISSTISNVLVPALKDAWEILKDFAEIGKEAWITFQQIVGVLNGDDSLDAATVSFQSIGTTLQHVTEDAHLFLQAIMSAEKVVAHLALALADIATGHFSAAADQIKDAFKSFTPGGGAIVGGVGGSAVGASVGATVGGALGIEGGPLGVALGAGAGGTVGSWAGAGLGALSGWMAGKVNPMAGDSTQGSTAPAGSVSDHLSSLAAAISKNTGIPAALLYGQLFHESGGGKNRGATDLHNYSGVKVAGSNEYRDFGTDAAYVTYLSRMYTDKKYSATGLLAAKNAGDFATDLKKAGYFGDSVDNYTRGIERAEGGYRAPGGGSSSGDTIITVQVATNANPDQIASAIAAKQSQLNVLNMANTAGVHQ